MRQKIARALRARCKAIKNALDEYNSCAIKLSPPRPTLTWTKVVDAVHLAELDILRDTRQDIRTLKWAQPAQREAMDIYFGLKRANEELPRLNMEIRRLLTFMCDDHVDYYRAVQRWIIADPPLAHELSTQWEYRDVIHEKIFRRLQQTAKLQGFTGLLTPSHRVGRVQDEHASMLNLPGWLQDVYALADDDEWYDVDEERLHGDEVEDAGGVIQFMDNLA
jgi:hypothetical protein